MAGSRIVTEHGYKLDYQSEEPATGQQAQVRLLDPTGQLLEIVSATIEHKPGADGRLYPCVSLWKTKKT